MGWFAELPGSQVSHRNYSSNIINMCALLRKPSKYDPAAWLRQPTQTVPKQGMKRISLPLPRHHTPPSRAGDCCGTFTAQGWHEIHTPGSYLSRPLPQPHGLVVFSTPPGKIVLVGIMMQPSIIALPSPPALCFLIQHTRSHMVGEDWGHPFLRKGSAVSQTTSSSTQPLTPCVKTRSHSTYKNIATAFPRGRGGKQTRISMILFLLQTLWLHSASPGICLPWCSSPASHLFILYFWTAQQQVMMEYICNYACQENGPTFVFFKLFA